MGRKQPVSHCRNFMSLIAGRLTNSINFQIMIAANLDLVDPTTEALFLASKAQQGQLWPNKSNKPSAGGSRLVSTPPIGPHTPPHRQRSHEITHRWEDGRARRQKTSHGMCLLPPRPTRVGGNVSVCKSHLPRRVNKEVLVKKQSERVWQKLLKVQRRDQLHLQGKRFAVIASYAYTKHSRSDLDRKRV